jgi:hypothetical protein
MNVGKRESITGEGPGRQEREVDGNETGLRGLAEWLK